MTSELVFLKKKKNKKIKNVQVICQEIIVWVPAFKEVCISL